MALVTFNRNFLEKLIGKKLSDSDYTDRLVMLGVPLERITEEEVDFEVFPNRSDLLSVEGFARAAQGFLGIKTGLPQFEVKKSNFSVSVDKRLIGLRGCAAFAVAKDLKFTDESIAAFMQLQDKLATTIGRKRKKVGLGTYDLDELRFPINYTVAPKSTKFVPLGFTEQISLEEIKNKHPKGKDFGEMLENWIEYPVYIDAKKRIMGIVPLTGAEFAKITSKTRNIFIEVTGTEWKAVMEILNIVTTALADRGARIFEVKTFYPTKKVIHAPDLRARRMKLDLNYTNELLDLDLKPKEAKEILEKMRFGMLGNDVLIPAYRTDIMHPIDLVEDIAIGHGYEKFEPHVPKIATIANPLEKEEYSNRIREITLGLGFQEVVTFILSNELNEFEKIKKERVEHVEILNPKTVDYTMARLSLIPSLLNVFAQNQSNEFPQKIFELGQTVKVDKNAETGAINVLKLCAGISDSKIGFTEMKSNLETFFRNFGKQHGSLASVRVKEQSSFTNFELNEIDDETFIGGRAAQILVGGKIIGVIGEIHPEVLNNFKIDYPVVLFELNIEKLK